MFTVTDQCAKSSPNIMDHLVFVVFTNSSTIECFEIFLSTGLNGDKSPLGELCIIHTESVYNTSTYNVCIIHHI